MFHRFSKPAQDPFRTTFQVLSLGAILAVPAAAQIPAFPGAQGFGTYATGGRGGDVYYVTNLNNNGAGSLRNGLSTAPAAGRTIVFAVSGYIPVVSDTNFNVPSKVTIAGQTAPGDGVGLRGGRMLISGSDVIMRHFRIRHGKNGTGGDCLNIANTAQKTMLDHLSLMFSTDENFSFFNSSVNNFTMQYSNSTWGMERHNAGGLWDLQNGSCHHTLWAHHRTRNPKARPNGLLEWINNVTFHWRNEGFIMGDSQTPMNWKANVRGCYYISIDDADEGSVVNNTALTKATVATDGKPNFSLYLDDTLLDNNDDKILNGTNRGYGIVSGSEFVTGDPVGANRYYKSATPFPGAGGSAAITVDDAVTGYKKVLSAGAPLRLDANYTGKLRDELDTLLVDSVVKQYSILVQKDGKVAGEDPARTNNGEQLLADQYGITNNGFGTLNGTAAPTDSDLDGMPDYWELSLNGQNGIGYSPLADDHNTAFTAAQLPNTFFPAGTPAGYTYLEEYLHFKALPHATMAANTAASPSVQTIDLQKYTDGFTASPQFTLTNVTNGTVQQFLANGTTPSSTGPVVKFTPTADHAGRAGFNFKVADSAGSQWTQQFAILVNKGGALQPPVRINVDLDRDTTPDPYSGRAAAPDTGTVWNVIPKPAASPYVLANPVSSTGIQTPYSVSIVSSGGTFSAWNQDTLGNPNPHGLMDDYLFGNSHTVTVSHLPPGPYQLYVYAHGDQANQVSTVTIDPANGAASATTASTGDQYRNIATAGAEGYSYLRFSPVVGAGGTLVFTVNPYFNGFQLVTAPTENYFVNFTNEAGATGATQQIAPMAGWDFSAAAPVAGNTWTVFNETNYDSSFPNPVNPGQTWTVASDVPLTTADGMDQKAALTMVYHAVTDALTSDRLNTVVNAGAIQPAGVMRRLMRNYWDRGGNGNFQRITISNLRAGTPYLLYIYGGSQGGDAGWRARVDLDRNGTVDLETANTTAGALFASTGGSNYGLTPKGGVWNVAAVTPDSSGKVVFDSRMHLNGFQIMAYQPPAITAQPEDQTVQPGALASFSVTAEGFPSPTYQWLKGSAPIPGATSPVFTIPSAATGDLGTYSVRVSNEGSSVTSNPATLAFLEDPFDTYVKRYGLDPAGNGAEGEDPDSDGIKNILEFFLGMNPTASGEPEKLPAARRATVDGRTALVFEFDRLKEAADVPYAVQCSPGLAGSWKTAVDGEDGVTIETLPGATHDRITVTIPTDDTRMFVRLSL